MDFVLARVKNERTTPYWNLLRNKVLFETIDLEAEECETYDPDHNLDDGCWFKIENFSKTSFCPEILKKDCSPKAKEYNALKRSQFTKIKYVIGIQGKDFYFQNFTKSNYISRKLISFGDTSVIEDDVTRIAIRELPDAVYFKDKDTLIFKKLSSITNIFRNINELYKEATKSETEDFLTNSFISLGNGFSSDDVSVHNRKRISMAKEVLSTLNANEKEKMFKYINRYSDEKIAFDATKNEFEVNSDQELKVILYGINERFYTTEIGQEPRVANSVLKL